MTKGSHNPRESGRACNTVSRRFGERVRWGISIAIVALSFAINAIAQPRETRIAERTRYQIELKIDFDALTYSGAQRVRWINRGDRATSTLYFHLYSNLRVEGQSTSADEPKIEVTKVRLVATDAPLIFALEEQGTTLRVNLRDSVAVGQSVEIAMEFRGSVPEIDPEESAITTHVIKQVSAALRDEREMRRARDLNFRCRGVMLLGSAYPVLAVQDGDDWRRRLEPGIGDLIFNESADYEVTVTAVAGVNVFAPGTEQESTAGPHARTFSGIALRDFAIVAGRSLRSEQTTVGQTTLRSVFLAEHERVGKQVLSVSAAALRVFFARFGSLPYKTITIAEAPLVAGLGSTEFSGLMVIASAFYVDFDSPAIRNLPEIIREQRPAVEQSLEWTVAHLLAHQWWGNAVGNDPAREPVVDEALSSWSALLYYEAVHGAEQAAIVQEDQLLGVYRLYRTFGGEDMVANRASRDYRNSFQYAAIVSTKGAMMFVVLRKLLGDEKFFAALSSYYKANQFEVARLDDLQGAFIAESPLEQRRAVARTFNRWLESKHGDEDIAKPDQELAASLGLPSKPNRQKKGDLTALSAFARVGKFFWQQMTRIR